MRGPGEVCQSWFMLLIIIITLEMCMGMKFFSCSFLARLFISVLVKGKGVW